MFCKVLFYFLMFHMSMVTEALFDTDLAYSILASKIDILNDEMSLLRKALTSAYVEIASTRAELGSVKKECGITTGTTSAATTDTPTHSSVTSTPEETCCKMVETSILEIKQEQHDARKDLETLIENNARALNEEISNTTTGLLTMEGKLAQLAEDFQGLSKNHIELKEIVEDHVSNYTEVIRNEIENADHCQSGYFQRWHEFPFTANVTFEKPFNLKPVFTMGTSLLDFWKDSNLRVNLVITHLSRSKFSVRISPWENTVAYAVGVRWMACPA